MTDKGGFGNRGKSHPPVEVVSSMCCRLCTNCTCPGLASSHSLENCVVDIGCCSHRQDPGGDSHRADRGRRRWGDESAHRDGCHVLRGASCQHLDHSPPHTVAACKALMTAIAKQRNAGLVRCPRAPDMDIERESLQWKRRRTSGRRIMATVTRIPRMHALPPMTRESRVIRSKEVGHVLVTASMSNSFISSSPRSNRPTRRPELFKPSRFAARQV